MSIHEQKQVIVMRTDLNMRKGKMIAQGAHASIAFVRQGLLSGLDRDVSKTIWAKIELTVSMLKWFWEGMTKICVRCESESELMEIAHKAYDAGLTVHVITDAGHTEFAGVPTRTCLAIGPNLSTDIDKITGHLKLL